MRKQILVPIADGTEEIEAVTIIDVLRRGGGDVTVASVNNEEVVCSRGVKITADTSIEECISRSFELIALPGGMPGAKHLADSAALKDILLNQQSGDRLYSAICAAPAIVLEPLGLLEGKNATCHPNYLGLLRSGKPSEERVVVDGNCITSRGPGTAIEFALELVQILFGKEKAEELVHAMVSHSYGAFVA